MKNDAAKGHYRKIRKELAEMLGFKGDPDALPIDEAMRLDTVFALKLSLDEMRGRLYRSETFDIGEMRTIADTLERYLPKRSEPVPSNSKAGHVARNNLKRLIANFIAADEPAKADKAAERIEQGLPAQPADYETALSEIETLRAENASLRAALPDVRALPTPTDDPERVITPSESDVVPPGEQGDRHFYVGKRYTPDDMKVMGPKPTIDGTVTRVNGGPPAAVSGDEGLVPQNGPPDWGAGQPALPDSSAHAAPWLRFQVSQ